MDLKNFTSRVNEATTQLKLNENIDFTFADKISKRSKEGTEARIGLFDSIDFKIQICKRKKCYQMRKYCSCNCMFDELVKAKFSNLQCHEKILKCIIDGNNKRRKQTFWIIRVSS